MKVKIIKLYVVVRQKKAVKKNKIKNKNKSVKTKTNTLKLKTKTSRFKTKTETRFLQASLKTSGDQYSVLENYITVAPYH